MMKVQNKTKQNTKKTKKKKKKPTTYKHKPEKCFWTDGLFPRSRNVIFIRAKLLDKG